MTMAIDLARQRAYVYRDDVRIGATGEGLIVAETAPPLGENERPLLSPEILSAGGYQSGPPTAPASSAGP